MGGKPAITKDADIGEQGRPCSPLPLTNESTKMGLVIGATENYQYFSFCIARKQLLKLQFYLHSTIKERNRTGATHDIIIFECRFRVRENDI